ncbi:pilin [Patescibacteria group bacterium]|nr:pilin [Patescibacteria group bacterium]MBU1721253.1 pilin [Patescibacteria group bacterium]MBU1901039.1 pilin [Patescibacteria group bacterium]
MRKQYSQLLLGSVAVAIVLFTSVLIVSAADYGLGEAASTAKLNKSTDVRILVGDVVGGALSFMGVLFFGLMLYGGFLWMTARGDEGHVTKGKDTIISAVIGLVIVLSSYAITQFIFESVSGNQQQEGPTATCEQVNPGWSCKNIKQCSTLGAEMSDPTLPISEFLNACGQFDWQCQRGLCSGGNEIVCCD